MPPLIIAALVAAVAFLIPRKRLNPALPVLIQTPTAAPTGIAGGFTAPPVQASVNASNAPSTAPVQTNMPSAASSGVPAWSANAVEFAPDSYYASPSPQNHIPPYYNGPIQSNLRPPFTPVKISVPKTTGSSCGCDSGHGSTSECSISQSRNRDGGCLSPTQQAAVKNTSPIALAAWAANMKSAGANLFQVHQQHHFDVQDVNPQGSDVTPPASPFLQPIGVSPRKPIRSAIA
jgi:hypothetical protein